MRCGFHRLSGRGLLIPHSAFRQLDPLRIGPEAFEVVELPDGEKENVTDHAAEVDEHPLARLGAFNPEGTMAEGGELLSNTVGNCLHLALAAAAADQDEVRVGGQVCDVEDDRLGGFLVGSRLGGL